MRIIFITAGPIEWASSRYRAFWVADELKQMGHEARAIQYKDFKELAAQALKKDDIPPSRDDVYIWQKVADLELINQLDGRHYWDNCDPGWWWEPELSSRVATAVDGIVFSTEGLLVDFKGEWKAYGKGDLHVIPDRFKLSHFTHRRKHTAVSPTRFVWYGIAANRVALHATTATLERLVANGYEIELTIMDDRPDILYKISDKFPIYHTLWSLDKEVPIITSHDIALLPSYPGAWGRVKSDNKKHLAYGCGLPVTGGEDYGRLTDLVTNPNDRTMAANVALDPVAISAQEWEAILL